jgi:uncharacterized cupredoxin-like copper-binding protein
MKSYLPLVAVFVIIGCAGAGALAVSAHEHSHAAEAYAAGVAGDPERAARIIAVTMQENPDGSMAFSPNDLVVKKGEQIRFELKNTGKAPHEFVLDSAAHNAMHRIAMEKHPEMRHDDPNGKRLDAGASADILWRFSKSGTYEFACLIPGHYEAGMHGKVVVEE